MRLLSFPTLRALAPAKINLNLDIAAKGNDGFHEISSLFHAVDWKDHLLLKPSSHFSLNFSKASSFPVQSPYYDLYKDAPFEKIYREAKKKFYSLPTGLDLTVVKNIPIGAGLGGGSSDIAAFLQAVVLWTERELWSKKEFGFADFSDEKQKWMLQMAQEYGSDVAFFFRGGFSHVTGRGEKIKNLPSIVGGDISDIGGIGGGKEISGEEKIEGKDKIGGGEETSEEDEIREDGEIGKAGKIGGEEKKLVLIYYCGRHISTKIAYNLYDEHFHKQPNAAKFCFGGKDSEKSVEKLIDDLQKDPMEGDLSADHHYKLVESFLNAAGKNDFFEVMLEKIPYLQRFWTDFSGFLSFFEEGAKNKIYKSISGSGSSLYGLFHGNISSGEIGALERLCLEVNRAFASGKEIGLGQEFRLPPRLFLARLFDKGVLVRCVG